MLFVAVFWLRRLCDHTFSNAWLLSPALGCGVSHHTCSPVLLPCLLVVGGRPLLLRPFASSLQLGFGAQMVVNALLRLDFGGAKEPNTKSGAKEPNKPQNLKSV